MPIMAHTPAKRATARPAKAAAAAKAAAVAVPPPPPMPSVSIHRRLTYRVREVIELTGFSQSSIYEMMDAGELRSTKVRGVRLIYADSLRVLLKLPSPQVSP